jgi:hypothetical protein
MRLLEKIKSTRFIIIQEAIILGVSGCMLCATALPKFPIEPFLIFLGGIAVGSYGIKTIQDIKDVKNGKPPGLR